MKAPELTRILVVPPSGPIHSHEFCNGLARYLAKGRSWLVQTMRDDNPRLPERAKAGGYRGAILVTCRNPLVMQLNDLGLKVVLVQRTDDKPPGRGIGQVEIDNIGVGRMGAEHLMAQGFTRLAYLGPPLAWSLSRLRGFREAVLKAGREYLEWIAPANTDWDSLVYGNVMERWLAKVERPIAVMAMGDEGARRVLELCLARRWTVPADIAVLGVDDHFFMRECLPIGLSSISFNNEQMGYQAAAVLDQMLRGSRPPAHPWLIPPAQVVVRQSTQTTEFGDVSISRAIAFIRTHATDNVNINDLLNLLNISRSTLDRRFAQVIGHSPAVEIREARLKAARRMLIETNMPLFEIAVASGFSSTSYFVRSFQQHFAMSPTRYRQTLAKQ